jgi:integrase/recombinase XerD
VNGHSSVPELVAAGDLIGHLDEVVRRATTGWLIGQRSPHTRRAYTRVIRQWIGWCDSHRVDPVNPARQHVVAYIATLEGSGYAPATIRQAHAALKSWHTELAVEGARAPVDVHHRVRAPRLTGSAAHRLLEDWEVRAMLAAARALDTPAETCVAMMATMGLRAAETGTVGAHCLDRSPWGPVVRIVGKGGVAAVIPVPAIVEAAAARHGWPDPTGAASRTDDTVYRRVRRWTAAAADVAGVDGYHPHMLRTWFISRALQLGVPSDVVQASARHASFDTTAVYARNLDRLEHHATRTVAGLVEDLAA